MELPDIVKAMRNLAKGTHDNQRSDEATWEELVERYSLRLKECASLSVLRELLASTDVWEVPSMLVRDTYLRALELGEVAPDFLRQYAEWLYLHGPAWDDEVKAIYERLGESYPY